MHALEARPKNQAIIEATIAANDGHFNNTVKLYKVLMYAYAAPSVSCPRAG